jgi:hypothetical protein
MSEPNRNAFGDLFDTFEREVFRLETLQVYTVDHEAEALAAFMAGQPAPPLPEPYLAWRRRMAEQTLAGKRWYRVHIVDRPLTDYVRWEFLAYLDSAKVGQETYIADRDTHPDLAKLTEDFWLFDDETVVRMRYDDEGRPLVHTRAAAEDLDEYLHRRDVAMQHAIPLDDYLAKHGDRLTA